MRGFCHGISGFDHGVGHPLLLLCDAKASNCQKNKAFKDLGHYSEWPKVADAVLEAQFPDYWQQHQRVPAVVAVSFEVRSDRTHSVSRARLYRLNFRAQAGASAQ
jgi:hypothetical protein